MAKRVAILQSNYIPWKGYFDLINSVDEFILYDDVQFTRPDWRNRNRIKTAKGTQWLTIPVQGKFRPPQTINETRVKDASWAQAHWDALTQTYAATPFFDREQERFAALYAALETEPFLSRINRTLLQAVCDSLGIDTPMHWSTDYQAEGSKTGRLVNLCKQAGATTYCTGPAAKAYLQEQLFVNADIEVLYVDYEGYPPYPQQHPPFDHYVTILDLLFNTGPDAPAYMTSVHRNGDTHRRDME